MNNLVSNPHHCGQKDLSFIAHQALNDDSFPDFEDGLQYYTAIENGQDLIITRNLKDFNASGLPVMTARQFLETLK